MKRVEKPTVKDRIEARRGTRVKKYLDFVLFEDYTQEIEDVLQEMGVKDERAW